MSKKEHPFQNWLKENDAVDVRFFPANASESSASQLLDDAMIAVTKLEQGATIPFEDVAPNVRVETL